MILYTFMFQWLKTVGEKGESVDVAFATAEKEIEMKITASQTMMARNVMVFPPLIKPLDTC